MDSSKPFDTLNHELLIPKLHVYGFNPIQNGGAGGGTGGGKKASPTSFSPLTSTNVGFSPQNFLTLSFNTFATLVQNFKFVSGASPKLLNLNQDHPSKKAIFLVKSS